MQSSVCPREAFSTSSPTASCPVIAAANISSTTSHRAVPTMESAPNASAIAANAAAAAAAAATSLAAVGAISLDAA